MSSSYLLLQKEIKIKAKSQKKGIKCKKQFYRKTAKQKKLRKINFTILQKEIFQFNFITLLTLLIKTSQIFVDVLMLYKYYIVYAYEFNLLLA